MKTRSILGTALLACVMCSSLPIAYAQSQSTNTIDLTPAETPFILVELSDSLNAKKLKPGDKIKALVAQDVVARGRILIPADSRMVGHVTEAKARARDENAESRLGIVFDKVVLKRHEELNFHGVVHALAPPVQRMSAVDQPDPMLPQITSRQNNQLQPLGGKTSSRQQSSASPAGPAGSAGTAAGQPVIPNQIPSSQTERAPASSSGSGSLSVGTRQGVFGLKGLSLATDGNGASGPVIVSNASDVKLDYGTQVLLRVTENPAAHP